MGLLLKYPMADGVGRNIWKSVVILTNIKKKSPITRRNGLHAFSIAQSHGLHTAAPNVTPKETAFYLQEPPYQNEETEAPLVLLFGWAGASHKNLSKYSSIYHPLGLATLQYILPTRFIFQHTHQVPAVMSSVSSALPSLCSRPVLIHCLSDTGVLCYQGLSVALAERGVSLDLRGVVWDSCPGPYPEVTIPNLAALLAIKWVCDRRDGLGRHKSLGSCASFMKDRVWPNYKRKFKGLPVELDMIQGEWMGHFARDHPGPTPELFIYSDADFYLPSAYLEKEVLPLREGKDCRIVKFAGSQHVCHLKQHKAEYTKQVHDFVNQKCNFNRDMRSDEDKLRTISNS